MPTASRWDHRVVNFCDVLSLVASTAKIGREPQASLLPPTSLNIILYNFLTTLFFDLLLEYYLSIGERCSIPRDLVGF